MSAHDSAIMPPFSHHSSPSWLGWTDLTSSLACFVALSVFALSSRYFMSWVESESGGRGGKGWVRKHLARYISIGGPMLGVPKVVTACLSGDTSDSIWLPDFASLLTDR